MSGHSALPRLVADPDEAFTGREIRRLTRRVTAARADAGPGELLTDVAYAVMSVVISVGLVVGIADTLRDVLAEAPGSGADAVLAPAWVQGLMTAALAAFGLGMAVRTGPLGIPGAGTRWWVPMPVDRTGLLTPSFWRAVLVGAAGGSAGAAVLATVAGVDTDAIAPAAAWGAVGGLLVVVGAGLVQPRPAVAGVLASVSDALVAAVPVVGLVLVATGGTTTSPGAWGWAYLVVAVVPAVALTVVWRRGLERTGAGVLRAQSAVAGRATGALLSIDTRELGRALQQTARRARRRTSRTWRGVRGPVTAVLAADGALLARTPAALAQVVGLAALLVLARQVPALGSGFGFFVLLVVAGFRAGQLGSEGARTAEMAPVLDSLLPLGARAVRLTRSVWPAVTAAAVVVVATLPLALGGDPRWSLLALVDGVALGAAAVRSAYRRAPDWSAPLMATPGGAVPTGALSAVRQGPDLAVFGSVPIGIALLLDEPTWGLLAAQVATAAIAVAVAAHVPARPRPTPVK